MIKVSEVFGEAADAGCARFGIKRGEYDRVFAQEGECRGVGLTSLVGGEIVIGECVSDGGALAKELLLRTLLLDATRVENFKTVINGDGDYTRYGFEKESDGRWVAITDKIIFPHECKGEHNVK